jgi:hypothetical protein
MPLIHAVVFWLMTQTKISEECIAYIFKIKVSHIERLADCMEVISTYQTTWCHNPKDLTIPP